MPHLHGMHQLLLCVKHELDAAMCASPQLLDDKVLVNKDIALQDMCRQQHALSVSSALQALHTVLTSDVIPACACAAVCYPCWRPHLQLVDHQPRRFPEVF